MGNRSNSPAALQALAVHVVEPLLRASGGDRELRVWVPACGTGEAAYAIGLLFMDAFAVAGGISRWRLQVFGTTADPKELAVAKAGFYPAPTAESLAGSRLDHYFTEETAGQYRVHDRLRDLMSFSVHDVSRDPPLARLDLVDARHVFATVPDPLHPQVLEVLQVAVRPRGFLCVAHGAPGLINQGRFTAVSTGAGIFRREADWGEGEDPQTLEDLRSLNDELRAANSQLHDKIEELHRSNERTAGRLAIRERQQAMVARLGLDALRTQDQGDLLRRVVTDLRTSLDVDYVGVFELALGVEELLLKAGSGWPDGYVGRESVAGDPTSHAGQVLASGMAHVFADLRAGDLLTGSLGRGTLGITSGACCSIEDEGDNTPYGVLGVYWRRPRSFGADDLHFLQSVANIVGSAIRRLRIANRVALERNVTQVLATVGDLDEAVGPLLEVLGASTGASLGELWLPDEQGKALSCRRVQRLGRNVSRPVVGENGTREVRKGAGLVGAVWAEQRARWVSDLPLETVGSMETARSACAVPILAGRAFIGVLVLYARERVLPDPGFLRTLDALGRSIGDFVRRTRAETEQARLAALVGSSSDAILSKDLNGIIRSWNGGAEKLYGYTAQEVIGRSAEIIYPDEHRGELRDILSQIAAAKLISHHETVRCRKDGSAVDVSVTISPVVSADGRIIGASAISRDISERKRSEARLREADRQKDHFLAMLSHELRNPLAAIITAAELMRHTGGGQDELGARARAIIARQASHMGRLLDGLLDVSRMVSGKIALHNEVVDLVQLLKGTVDDWARGLEERRLQLRTDLPSEPIWVWGDPVRLAQVFDQLLGNAIKFTPEGGSVRIELERTADCAVVRMLDTGSGIDAELLPHIFEPFRQAQQSLARPSGGLGVGLALVKGLVELHGGTVVAKSDGTDQGSTFTVSLRLSEHQPVPSSRFFPADQSARILVVEDDRDTADALRDLLVLEGFQADVVYTGESAVDTAPQIRPHLVLCDIGLPGAMSGYDVAMALRQVRELDATYLVALTGYGAPQDVEQAAQAGFDAHLTKPVEVETISRLLAELRQAGGGPSAANP